MDYSDARIDVRYEAEKYQRQAGWRVVINDVLAYPMFEAKALAEQYAASVREGRITPTFGPPKGRGSGPPQSGPPGNTNG